MQIPLKDKQEIIEWLEDILNDHTSTEEDRKMALQSVYDLTKYRESTNAEERS